MEDARDQLDAESLEALAEPCTGRPPTCPCQACAAARWRARDEMRDEDARQERARLSARRAAVLEGWSVWARAARGLYGSGDPRCVHPTVRKARKQVPVAGRGSPGSPGGRSA